MARKEQPVKLYEVKVLRTVNQLACLRVHARSVEDAERLATDFANNNSLIRWGNAGTINGNRTCGISIIEEPIDG